MTQNKIRAKCEQIKKMLLAKNKQYGDSVINPIRLFAKSGPKEQVRVRIDDKLNRLIQGDDSIESDLDIYYDLVGYLILLIILEENEDEQNE
tara:strand:- start:485 stop:760 length:276 start_codon:yes stop_codon:yes gene_type:complete